MAAPCISSASSSTYDSQYYRSVETALNIDNDIQARISVKYCVPNLKSARYQKARRRKQQGVGESDGTSNASLVPKAALCLKAYDPESGVCLQFKTDRAAEVGRLITGLGRLGRHMAALPQKTEGE